MEVAQRYDRLYERLKQIRPYQPNAKATAPTTSQSASQPSNQRVRAEDYKPGTTGPMDIDTARKENKCRHCRQPWTFGHSCEKKTAAQSAWKNRTGKSPQVREVRKDAPDDFEAQVAALRDQLDIANKKAAAAMEAKDFGN